MTVINAAKKRIMIRMDAESLEVISFVERVHRKLQIITKAV